MHRSLRLAVFALCATVIAACSSQGSTTLPSAPQQPTQSIVQLPSQSVHIDGMAPGKSFHAYLPRPLHAAKSSGGSNLVYHGGPIQKNPKVYVIYWGFTGSAADPDGVAPYLTKFLQGLSGTPYYDIMTQYYSNAAGAILDPPGEYAGSWYDTTNKVPNNPSDTQIANEAVRAVAQFGYDYDASYVVQLPHGAYGKLRWCAYHSVTSSSYGDVHYTDLPYQPDLGTGCGVDSVNSGAQGLLDSTSETAAHEIAETQTDPDTKTGWIDASGNEIGDYCSYINLQNITLSTGTFATQPLWSNAANYCAMSYP